MADKVFTITSKKRYYLLAVLLGLFMLAAVPLIAMGALAITDIAFPALIFIVILPLIFKQMKSPDTLTLRDESIHAVTAAGTYEVGYGDFDNYKIKKMPMGGGDIVTFMRDGQKKQVAGFAGRFGATAEELKAAIDSARAAY